jgi:hypothetical protein
VAGTGVTIPSGERGRTRNWIARVNVLSRSYVSAGSSQLCSDELSTLFHRLNNQLGVVLACAEHLEAKATDEAIRSRASEVVAKALDALVTVREIRQQS